MWGMNRAFHFAGMLQRLGQISTHGSLVSLPHLQCGPEDFLGMFICVVCEYIKQCSRGLRGSAKQGK